MSIFGKVEHGSPQGIDTTQDLDNEEHYKDNQNTEDEDISYANPQPNNKNILDISNTVPENAIDRTFYIVGHIIKNIVTTILGSKIICTAFKLLLFIIIIISVAFLISVITYILVNKKLP